MNVAFCVAAQTTESSLWQSIYQSMIFLWLFFALAWFAAFLGLIQDKMEHALSKVEILHPEDAKQTLKMASHEIYYTIIISMPLCMHHSPEEYD